MGRKAANDKSPVRKRVIQMVVSDDEYYAFHRFAQGTKEKSASKWLREHVRRLGHFKIKRITDAEA